jgi:cholesterol transport system auxiliary component
MRFALSGHRSRYFSTTAAIAAALCALIGCTLDLTRPSPVKRYYMLEAVAQPSTDPPAHQTAVRISGFEVAPPFGDRALVYRLDVQRYDADFYNEFFVVPRAMVTTQITQWLTRRGIFSAVIGPTSTLDAAYLMEGIVNEMYADVRPGLPFAAVFAMQVFLTEPTSRTVILDKSYAQTVYLADQNAETVVKGLSQAFNQVMENLERDLRALPPVRRSDADKRN